MKKQLLIIMGILLTSLVSQAQLSLSPAPASGELVLTGSNTYIYFTNTTSAVQTPTISVGSNAAGISISSNRCTTIRAGQSCYVIINFPGYASNSSTYNIPLSNGATQLAMIKFNPTIVAPQVSNFNISSMAMNDFSTYSFVVTNKTSSSKSYAPSFSGTDASKFSITLNRCNSIAPNGTCQVFIKLAPQMAGSYSASITEPQVTGSISLSSTISSATVGVIQPPNPSISLSASTLAFGTITNLGKTSSKSVLITNNGNIAVSPIVSVSGSGLEIALNRCLVLLSPNQSCSVSVLINAVSSMSNGPLSGLSLSAKADSASSPQLVSVSGTLAVNPVLLSSSSNTTGIELDSYMNLTYGGAAAFYKASSHKLYIWGSNDYYGIVGNGSGVNEYSPVALNLPGKTIAQASVNGAHALVLTTDNLLYSWGYNYAGQVGDGTQDIRTTPVSVVQSGALAGKTIKKIATGEYNSCALDSDGKVYCWGANGNGASGVNDTVNQFIIQPTAVDTSGVMAGKVIKDITVSYSSACALSVDNLLFCWGSNGGGLLGNGSGVDEYAPVSPDMSGVLAGKTIKKYFMTYSNTCVIASDDKPYCWGGNYYGTVGNGDPSSQFSTPQAVDMSGALAGKTVKDLWLSDSTACAIASDDKLYCWGGNFRGQLADGIGYDNSTIPVAVDTSGALAGKIIKKVKSGTLSGGTVCAQTSDNKLYCWGNNYDGQLGNGSNSNFTNIPSEPDPAGLMAGKTVKDFVIEGNTVCVHASDDNAYCIGMNGSGQLGDGTGVSSMVWVQAPTP